LQHQRARIVLAVRDNGRGITAGELAASSSLGLLGMRERAQLLGGTLEIRGSPGRGTVAKLLLPLPAAP
jgi:signal transduction histidine kinase